MDEMTFKLIEEQLAKAIYDAIGSIDICRFSPQPKFLTIGVDDHVDCRILAHAILKNLKGQSA